MIRPIVSSFRRRWFAGIARQEDLDRLYAQVQGLFQIQQAMLGQPALRPLRGWAMSPDALAWILCEIQERTAPTVVEFGSGQSTLILAATLKHCQGRLISVEHDAQYAEAIRRQVMAGGFHDVVDFIFAPLDSSNQGNSMSYRLAAVPKARIDIAVVDGPPSNDAPLARLAPLRWGLEHLNPGGVIFLDDAMRAHEKDCVQHLQQEYPQLTLTMRNTEKGLLELRQHG